MPAIVFDLQGTLIDHNSPPALFKHARTCLDKFHGKIPLVLVSAGRGLNDIDSLLKELKIRHLFQVVFHLKDSQFKKEDGSAFLEISRQLHVLPSELIVVGDVPFADIKGAKMVGATAIRIRQGKYAALEPSNNQEVPDHEIFSLDELPDLIRKLLPDI